MGRFKSIIKGTLYGLILAIISASFGCFGQPSEPMIQIKVQTRNCLIRICEKYLENPGQWKKIAKLNSLRNPDLIYPGQIINIPASLFKKVPAAGTVTFVRGNAEFSRNRGVLWNSLVLNGPVEEGDMIRTGPESGAEITFEDGNIFALKENTTVGLPLARRSPGNHSAYKLALSVGKIVSNVQNSPQQKSVVQIATPSSIAGIRGTIVRSSVDSEDTSRFEVLKGRVEVGTPGKSVFLDQGKGTVVRKDEPPMAPVNLLPPPSPVALNPLYKKTPIRIAFEKVDGALSYRIVLSADKGMKDIVDEQIVGQDGTFIAVRAKDGTCFLQSSSIDRLALEGPPSEPVEVHIRIESASSSPPPASIGASPAASISPESPVEPAGPTDARRKILGKDGSPMVLVPAGEFWMGSPQGEGALDEHPSHKVYLDAYYLDEHEVTVAQYRQFCEGTGKSMPAAPRWGWQDSDPMVNVTWEDASAYAVWAGKRLPTEAEWEKACRAGTTTAFYGGNALSSKEANFDGSNPFGGATEGVFRGKPAPVGTFKPNAYGLFDMSGNVREWCADWYNKDYYVESPRTNPTGPKSGTSRVSRGGSWYDLGNGCRSAYRFRNYSWFKSDLIGFRCALSPAA